MPAGEEDEGEESESDEEGGRRKKRKKRRREHEDLDEEDYELLDEAVSHSDGSPASADGQCSLQHCFAALLRCSSQQGIAKKVERKRHELFERWRVVEVLTNACAMPHLACCLLNLPRGKACERLEHVGPAAVAVGGTQRQGRLLQPLC